MRSREKDRPNYEDRKAQRRAYYEANKEKFRGYEMASYGITLSKYDEMFEAQGGLCAICREPEEGKRLAVDHDHATNRVRGLLCFRCNTTLGRFEAQREAILDYLESYA
jgi:hypothetical protein